ncbi:hypothetical protein TEA_027078 [Camellia sinensis var. sinensis]|uniref:Uncharacterized protein n=1 Tax=Camellia sinensis var. sinensis TaxID=542762 RepID=A0A4S4D6P6_CAMSN|nr:hypothetical protein TEA_027078 [Camellia sinensis var. sinensis]
MKPSNINYLNLVGFLHCIRFNAPILNRYVLSFLIGLLRKQVLEFTILIMYSRVTCKHAHAHIIWIHELFQVRLLSLLVSHQQGLGLVLPCDGLHHPSHFVVVFFLSHKHLRQSAARPAGGVSVTSGKSGSAISSKTRIRWTQDLHDRFVECVNHLGGAESNTEGDTEANGLGGVNHLSCEKPFVEKSFYNKVSVVITSFHWNKIFLFRFQSFDHPFKLLSLLVSHQQGLGLVLPCDGLHHPSHFVDVFFLSHGHLRQSAARPAGGVLVTSGKSGSVISSKTRIRWTQDLHDRFVECVNHLGGAESNTEGDTEANGLGGVNHLSCEKPFVDEYILPCSVYLLGLYSRHDKRSKLPRWILSHLRDAHLNLSTDMAMHIAREFLRKTAQPYDKSGGSDKKPLLSQEDLEKMGNGGLGEMF